MIVVSNTTPIIALSSIKKIELLRELYQNIYIPEEVYNEIKSKKRYGFSEIDSDFFIVKRVQGLRYVNFLLNDVDRGEAEAITLAIELNADLVLIDERIGYKVALSQKLACFGTLGILSIAKRRGLILKIKHFSFYKF